MWCQLELGKSESLGKNEAIRNVVLWAVWIAVEAGNGERVSGTVCVLAAVQCLVVSFGKTVYSVSHRSTREQKWGKLLKTSRDGVLIVSRSLHVTASNPAALSLLHISPTVSLKSSLYLLPTHCAPPLISLISDMFKSRSQLDLRLEIENQSVELRGIVVGDDAILFLRDLTPWVSLESTAQMETARRQALLRSVSHELKTPTNAIVNICEELKETIRLSAKEQVTLTILSSSSKFLLSMINDLLDCALISNGKFELRKAPFRLEDAVKECAGMIEAQCRLKGVCFTLRYDQQLPCIVFTDQWRLRQVLLNLLSNAMKFTLKGSIEVVVMSASKDRMRVTVKDTGIGLLPQTMARVMEMFRAQMEGGVRTCSLGLSIANAIVTALSGSSISVKSTPGSGSKFSFDVRIKESDSLSERQATGFEDESCNNSEDDGNERKVPYFKSACDQAHILIVDDNEFNRMVLFRLLETNGYKCHQAFTGFQALAAVRKMLVSGRTYKVVLMDIDNPEMDCLRSARELRELVLKGELRSMPAVVACSEHPCADNEDVCREAGMSHYLEKPISRDALLRMVAKLVPLECQLEE